ncbi:CsbD family protein [Sinomonas sp. RB5]
MGLEDKFDAAADKLKGKVEEAVGRVTDDRSKVVRGKVDQAKGGLKDTVADLKAHTKDSVDEADADRRRTGEAGGDGLVP